MKKEKSIYADILESAISWRVRDMYNLYGTIRRVLFEGRRAERAAMLSELIKMQGGALTLLSFILRRNEPQTTTVTS